MKTPTFKMIAGIQLLLVISASTCWWLYRTSAYLRTPIGPYGEYYAHNWGFQGLVGALYLCGLLAITAFVIILERWICSLFTSRRST
jgi:hypothetical protein